MPHNETQETSLEKSLRILHALSTAREGMTVSELSSALGYPPSTVARLLGVLKRTGYVWQGSRRGVYKLGYDILELAGNLLKNMEVRQAARPYLHELAANTHLPAQLKVTSGIDVVVVDVAVPPLATPLTFEMGSRMLMHTSTLGRTILAYRDRDEIQDYVERANTVAPPHERIQDLASFLSELKGIRDRGYEARYVDGRFHSVAAPIMRYDARAIASVGAGSGFGFSPAMDPSEQAIQHVAQETVATARKVSFALGYHASQLTG